MRFIHYNFFIIGNVLDTTKKLDVRPIIAKAKLGM